MLSENIKAIRKSKGLSQDELAIKLNVVRQTVSKWERGLSVPDSEMLISIADALEVPVSRLLGETVEETVPDDLKAISEKLEVVNLQFAGEDEGFDVFDQFFRGFFGSVFVIHNGIIITFSRVDAQCMRNIIYLQEDELL